MAKLNKWIYYSRKKKTHRSMNHIKQAQSRPMNSKILLDLGSCQTHKPMNFAGSRILLDP